MQNLQAEGKTSGSAVTLMRLFPSGAPGELALLPGVRLQEGDLRYVRPQDH